METYLINKVDIETRTGKNNIPYNIYKITYNDNLTATTIKKNIGEFLKNKAGQQVQADIKPNDRGYMEVVAVEGVEVKKNTGRRLSDEDRARIEQRIKEKDNAINRSVALNNATSLVSAMVQAGHSKDAVSEALLLADTFYEWLTRKEDK